MAHVFLGLDGEMTAADLAAGGRLIQIGLAVGEGEDDRVCELIGWGPGEFTADPTAMAVHGIPEKTILAAPRAEEVDARLSAWCLARWEWDLEFVVFQSARFRSMIMRRVWRLPGILSVMVSLERFSAVETFIVRSNGRSPPKTWVRMSVACWRQ